MNIRTILVYMSTVIVGIVTATTSLVPAREETIIPKSCTMERIFKMIGYDCSDMNLKEVPQYLRTDLQVFDVSMNRIRELRKDTFDNYPDLKFLYLFENMIWIIDDGAFADLTNLEALDLSNNFLLTIPLELFNLPRLRNLYLSDNKMVHLPSNLKHLSRPIRAPLQHLNIANCQLMDIPDFGILPNLIVLNISHNDLAEINPHQLSPFCSLQIIDVNATRMTPCTCQSVSFYLRRRSITIKNGLSCESVIRRDPESCTDLTNATTESIHYHECLQNVRDIQLAEGSRRTWLSIFGGLFTFLVVFMAILFICHRRNVQHTKKYIAESKLKQVHTTENGKIEILLNDTK